MESKSTIQIIGLRPYTDKDGKPKVRHKYFTHCSTVPNLFKNIDKMLELIPKEEQWNIYYTAPHCKPREITGGALRCFSSQKIIPLDIDGIDESKIDQYIDIVCKTLEISREKTGIVFSGNGLQLIIELNNPFTNAQYFVEHRVFYRSLCDNLNAKITEASLPGTADPAVWSDARLLRLPNTENRKPKKGNKRARLIQPNIEPQEWDWHKKSGIEKLKKDDYIQDYNSNTHPEIDAVSVYNECSFIKWTKEFPGEVREPHYYAAISILSRMEKGGERCHRLAEAIKGSGSDSSIANFSASEIDRKVKQALEASGPRTCKNVQGLWGGCSQCKHYGKVNSPITIKSDDFIATKKTGFYFRSKKGMVPDYAGLAQYLDRSYHHKTNGENGLVFVWKDNYYQPISKDQLRGFAHENFDPKPTSRVVEEFLKWVTRTNLIDNSFFNENIDGYLNCKNGILDLKTKKLTPHSPEYGFKYCLPYEYDPSARAPRFDKFLDEVTGGDNDKRKIIEEFCGYAISGDKCWIHKALLLSGEGRNGKSTLIQALQLVAGDKNYSNVELEDLRGENNRQLLEGKLFNVAEEISHNDMRETKILKNLVAGGGTRVKLMWHQPYFIENRAKLIFGCNRLPSSTDVSFGFLERMIIIDFDQRFVGEKADKFIIEKLKRELSGILNVFLNGYDRLCEKKEFSKAKAAELAKEEYSTDNNIVKYWLSEVGNVTVHPLNGREHFATTDELHQEFLMWAHGKGDTEKKQSVSVVEFGRLFQAAVTEGKQRYTRKRFQGFVKRGYWDVQLTKSDI